MGRKKLYVTAAEGLIEHMEAGRYLTGEKLPSIRALSQQLQLSISTVQMAYLELEKRGWVYAKYKSGYFVTDKVTQAPPQPRIPDPHIEPKSVYQWQKAVHSQTHNGEHMPFRLGRGWPDIQVSSLEPLKRWLAKYSRAGGLDTLGYAPQNGLEVLRQQIARRGTDAGCRLLAEDVMVTSGCLEAVNLALRAVTQPGDLVVIESPSYYGFIQSIEALNLKVLEIPSDPAGGMSMPALELALKQWPVKACLMLANYSNPLSQQMSDVNKQRVVELTESHDVVLIEDDVYAELGYSGGRGKALKAFDKSGNVILCSSFSKTLAPGLRVGWVLAGKYAEKIEQLKFVTNLSSSPLPQLAIARFLEEGGLERHLRRVIPLYRQRKEHLRHLIQTYFPAGTRMTDPQGGYFLWVELPPQVDGISLCSECAAQGISIAPGAMFSSDNRFNHFIRLNYSAEQNNLFEQAIRTIAQLVEKRCI